MKKFYGYFRHGDCIGADAQAHTLAKKLGYKVIIYPPKDDAKRAFCRGAIEVLPEKPYLERNRDIVDDSVILIAAPSSSTEVLRSGTWAAVRYARKKRETIFLVFPDGNIVQEHSSRD